jgi:signal transduction histidine kinase
MTDRLETAMDVLDRTAEDVEDEAVVQQIRNAQQLLQGAMEELEGPD